MTILFADGFDDCSATDYAPAGYYSISTTNGRRAGSSAIKGEGYSIAFAIPSASTVFVQVAIKIPALPGSDTPLLFFRNGGDAHVQLKLTPSGAIQVLGGASTVLATSAGGLFSAGIYTLLTVKVVVHDTTGSIEVRLNGSATAAVSTSNVDTRNGATTAIDNIQLPLNVYILNVYWDDLVIWDDQGSVNNTWMGDLRVDSYLPNADGDATDMTPSTGTSHFALVDEVPSSGTDYVQSATVGHKDLYQMADMSHTPLSIKAVVQTAMLMKDDAGTRSGALMVKSSATESVGSDISPSTSTARYSRVLETDPATSAAWTKAAVDALQVGVKVTG